MRSLCVRCAFRFSLSPDGLSQHLHVVRLGGRKMLTVALRGRERREGFMEFFTRNTLSRAQTADVRSRTSGSSARFTLIPSGIPYASERDRGGEATTSHSYKI